MSNREATHRSVTTDPVCGMSVDPDGPQVEHDGETYHFCSERCRDQFAADPDAFTRPHDHQHTHGHGQAGRPSAAPAAGEPVGVHLPDAPGDPAARARARARSAGWRSNR